MFEGSANATFKGEQYTCADKTLIRSVRTSIRTRQDLKEQSAIGDHQLPLGRPPVGTGPHLVLPGVQPEWLICDLALGNLAYTNQTLTGLIGTRKPLLTVGIPLPTAAD